VMCVDSKIFDLSISIIVVRFERGFQLWILPARYHFVYMCNGFHCCSTSISQYVTYEDHPALGADCPPIDSLACVTGEKINTLPADKYAVSACPF
jgi:hypothetical protein